MKMYALVRGVTLLLCSVLPVSVSAQTVFPAGEYQSNGGWGQLIMKAGNRGGQAFELQSLGANGHSCTLSGMIRQGKAVLLDGDSRCVVSFQAMSKAIRVSADGSDACRGYCGARAMFDGVYTRPAAGCDTASLRKTRNAFKKLYDQKNYAQAERTLAPVLQNCKRTLFWLEDGSIRNDLALTQAKLGKGAACYKTLQPLAKDTAKTDKAVCDSDDRYLPPVDCTSYLSVVQAARTNLKWCARAGK